MIHFECDYTEGCCVEILEALNKSNFEQTSGYGEDSYCKSAIAKIKKACNSPQADVHFLVGGTQANLTIISSILKPYQGVIAPETGHIAVHETGAIESCGHKVLTIPAKNGKISATQIQQICENHFADSNHEHTVQPRMVYISFPTESGSLYSKSELENIYETCKKNNLPLFIDGARLGYGLASEQCDCTLQDIAQLCDVFYIGGTKVGALFGEAVVILNKMLQKDFRYMIKQKGGLLAKGRLLGLQFDTLFTDNLYFDIAKQAINQALRIKEAFLKKNIPMHFDSPTNQLFPILTTEQQQFFDKKYITTFWEKIDENRAVIRFCTSWATKDEYVNQLITDIESC